jgi:gliding motility-associated protein GldM
MKKYTYLLLVTFLLNGVTSCQNEKNLPDSILNSLHQFETSMNRSYSISEQRTYEHINYLKFNMANFPEKVIHLHDSALVAVKETMIFVEFIEQLQKNLETNTGGRLKNGHLANGNEMKYHHRVLFDEGKAAELQQRINDLRFKFMSLLDSSDHRNFKTELYAINVPESKQSWGDITFRNTPLVAAMAVLSKIKNDAKDTENRVLGILAQNVPFRTCGFSFTSQAMVLPKSNVVKLGEEYEADIFVFSYGEEINPVFVNGQQVGVINGMGKYRVKPTREGVVTYKGEVIAYGPLGEKRSHPFEMSYEVVKPGSK